MFFLDRFFVGPAKVKMLKMVLADQALFAPPALFIIISFLSVLKGQSVEQWKNQMSENYPTILATNYKLWPVAQLINFNFTPLRFRVLYINTVALFWNVYISYQTQAAPASSCCNPDFDSGN
ncbi:unnamed protein product [Calicophoron daubneyi]|uniref:Mitochondrial inner membrane protein Mpv17 n=1 Tax=Calicophoron daubneyi TaxID=300641 RepID=A0AAV2T921_CALDB